MQIPWLSSSSEEVGEFSGHHGDCANIPQDWRRGENSKEETRLLSLFADDPRAPFSIHKFVEHGAAACGKHPGEWFGPSATANCIQYVVSFLLGCYETDIYRSLSEQYPACGLKVYVTSDGADVYEDVLLRLAKPENNVFHPVLILVGIRLGIERVTPAYWEGLQRSLQLSQSMGIAG